MRVTIWLLVALALVGHEHPRLHRLKMTSVQRQGPSKPVTMKECTAVPCKGFRPCGLKLRSEMNVPITKRR